MNLTSVKDSFWCDMMIDILFSFFRVKKFWATSSQHPCASSSLISLPPPPAAGSRPPPCPCSISSWARSGPLPRPAAVPWSPVRAMASPRTAQGGCGWPPSRRTPAATLTWERTAWWTISQPQEPACRLRNPPTRIWQKGTCQPGTGGDSRGRTALTVKRLSAESKQPALFVWKHQHVQAT